MIDLTSRAYLKDVIEDMDSTENVTRKQNSFVAYDIYNNNQHQYVMNCLCQDYPEESAKAMRKVTSINFAKRIVEVEAAVYKHAPERTFMSSSDQVIEQLENIYSLSKVNHNNKMANRFYRMDDQCAMMIVPNKTDGTIGMRKLQNWQYDVIPHPDWPEQALAYIIPLGLKPGQVSNDIATNSGGTDNMASNISDKDNAKRTDRKFILWSDEYNFMFNANGVIETPKEDWENPIGMMPIVDISGPKQNTFLMQNDNNLSRFTIDFLCSLSDLATIVQMQGFAQAILSATEIPREVMIGPQRMLFLEKKKGRGPEEQPEFQFASPSPDLQGSREFNESLLRMFLSSRGNKTNVITGGSDSTETPSSGLDRLLMMIEQHELSIDDFTLFDSVEQKQFEIFRRTSNHLRETNIEGFELHKDLQVADIPEDTFMEIEFHEPQMLETDKEMQDRLGERLDNGTLSAIRYVMAVDKVDEDTARALLAEVDENVIE